ncbi:MAG: ribose 5-phosphate isomerase B [Nitrospirota bacterium]
MDGTGKIAIASDHAGVDLKDRIVKCLQGLGQPVEDLGTNNQDSVDYPDYGLQVAQAVSEGTVERGILICGTGIGMSIVANKFPGVRAALCQDLFTAEVSRRHNDANVLVLGGRVLEGKMALEIVQRWLATGFDGGRHARRLAKIEAIEKNMRQKNIPRGK